MTPYRLPSSRPASSRAGAFTLIEILVVIGIILLLSAILFPAFKSIQERGAQTTCASNMQQLYLAVRLYKDDEREYPANLAALLPDTETLEDTATPPDPNKGANTEGTGYFRKTREELVCPDDDFQVLAPVAPAAGASPATPVRSSYGDTSTDATKGSSNSSETIADATQTPWKPDGSHNTTYYGASDTRDWGRLAWNYWGYDDWGQGFRTQQEALNYAKGQPAQVGPVLRDYDANAVAPTPKNTKAAPTGNPGPGYIADPGSSFATPFYFNPRGIVFDVNVSNNPVGTAYEEPRAANMWKYSLSNPQAPLGTIITHCAYHRLQTGTNIFAPSADQLYSSTASTSGYDGTGARDIILRLDGTARSYDVSKWNQADFPRATHGSNWQISDF